MKKIAVFTLMLIFMSGTAYAMNHETKTEQLNKAEAAGNKSCPVSGESIDEKSNVTYEYKGKIYNFCCTMCVEKFKNDPDKYIEELEKTEKGKGREGHKHHEHKH